MSPKGCIGARGIGARGIGVRGIGVRFIGADLGWMGANILSYPEIISSHFLLRIRFKYLI